MTSNITKAVIPAAGWGTRFLPVTKSCPKELLPIIDHPGIFHVLREVVAAGIEEVVLVISQNKELIKDFFTPNQNLNEFLKSKNNSNSLRSLMDLQSQLKITYVEQKQALGLGHAVFCARNAVGNNPFAVLLPDEVELPSNKYSLIQLIQNYRISQLSTVSIMEVPTKDVSKYGIVDLEELSVNRYLVKNLIEKPTEQDAPSRFALPGRYIFDPEIFNILEKTKPGRGGEIQLTDAMIYLAKTKGLEAIVTNTRRFDTGTPLGFLKANIEFCLEDKNLKTELKTYLEKLCKNI